MINASGDTSTNLTPTEKKKTDVKEPVVPVNLASKQPTANPGFPTHNPAMQHQKFMGDTGVPTTSQAKKEPVSSVTGATPPAAPKFPDPTKNLIKVTKAESDTVKGSDGKDTTKPKRKLNIKMVVGIVVLLLVILGSGAGFYLTQYTQQDIRQQAYVGKKGCTTDAQCDSARKDPNVKEYCVNSVCTTNKPKDSNKCANDTDCKSGYFCAENKTCLIKKGNYCNESRDCSPTDYCDTSTNRCKLIKDSDKCTTGSCNSGYYCSEKNVCEKLKDSDKCKEGKCSAGYYCSSENVCVKLAATGASCDNGVAHGGTACNDPNGTQSYEYICNNGTYEKNNCPSGQTCQGNSCKSGTGTLQCQNGAQDRDQTKVLVCNCDKCKQKTDNSEGGGGTGWVCDDNCKLVDIGSVSSAKTSKCNQVDYVHQGTSNYCGVQSISCPDSCKTTTTTPNYKCNSGCSTTAQCQSNLGNNYSCVNSKCRLTSNPGSSECKPATSTTEISCDNITGTLKTSTVELTTPLSYKVDYSGTGVTKVELVTHGNFSPPALNQSWDVLKSIVDTSPVSGSISGNTTYQEMLDRLVLKGHDRQKLLTQGILYYANVHGPQGFCTGSGTWSVGGAPCTVNNNCNGVVKLTPEVGKLTCDDACTAPAAGQADQCTTDIGEGYSCINSKCRLTSNPTSASCTPKEVVALKCDDTCTAPTAGQTDQCTTDIGAGYSCINSKCRLTANPDSKTCVAALTCNQSCTPSATNDLCTEANANWTCDSTSSKCRYATNLTSEECVPPVGAIACNAACTSDEQCTKTNTNYTCDSKSGTCRLAENPDSEECEVSKPGCNDSCNSDEECQRTDSDHICDSNTNTCRLKNNTGSETCEAPVETVGCNDTCVTNSDCTNSNHVCSTTADGSLKCRLEENPNSDTCTLPGTTTTSQPVAPEVLPETGPEDWLNWFKAGLVTLGIGTALFFLL